LQQIISNGYQDDPKKVNTIDNYKIDKALSGQRVQVYHNKDTDHLVMNHRGTKGIHDVVSDIGLMFLNREPGNLEAAQRMLVKSIIFS
jgi:hypothetical protein